MQPYFNLAREKKNQLGCYAYKNDWCSLQFHSQIEVYMIDEGEMEMFVDGKYKTLKKGDISIALSYVPHAYKTPKFSLSTIVFIPTHLCEEFMTATDGKKLISPFICDNKIYEELKKYAALMQQEKTNTIKQLGFMNVFLGIILENSKFESSKNPIDSELISKILFYINENYTNDISPSHIAKHFGYSQSHISRYFKSACGINLARYIALMRLRHIVMLMNEGHHSITNCILESGFSSSTTFYRTFKKEFGCSPKEYFKKLDIKA